jgi:two-component system, OmpR family, response regulator
VRILVVEDDEKIATFVVNGLKQSGFSVDHAADGEQALALFRAVNYDAAVLDIMLPKLDGLSVLRRVRADKNRTPVLLLSAKASVDNRVSGLQAGGDDYLTKPFAFSELLARVQALIRRATQVTEPTSLCVGDLSMDLLSREVTRGGQKIDYSFDPQTNVVDVLAHRLRAKLEKDFAERLIHTIRGVGYVLKAT